MSIRFDDETLEELARGKILRIRAGREHRFIGIWVVVVGRRVFVRSWDVKPDGWVHAFTKEPHGTIQVGNRELRVRAIRTRSERVKDAVDAAYAAKYTTPGAQKYVRGFRTKRRRDATIELAPQ